MNQNDLNTLSYVIDNIGFNSMELGNTSMAIANYRESEPAIINAMLSVFAMAIQAQAQRLEELAEILETVYHSQTEAKP